MVRRRSTGTGTFAAGLSALVVALLAVGCGGSQTPPAHSADRDDDDASSDGATEAGGDGAESKASYCTDEGCFDCGETFCMAGWYCDLGIAGGPACSFVPACNGAASCGCVTPALGGACRCEERDGGVFVTCS